jgi:hypothetical protein
MILDKSLYRVSTHPKRSTLCENYNGEVVHLIFGILVDASQKSHIFLFFSNKWKITFYKESWKLYLPVLFVMKRCTSVKNMG